MYVFERITYKIIWDVLDDSTTVNTHPLEWRDNIALGCLQSHATPPAGLDVTPWYSVSTLCSLWSRDVSVPLCVGAAESINHRGRQVLYVKDSEERRGSFSLH